MDIGVIGAGMIGGTLGKLWLAAGHRVRFGTRHPQGLGALVELAPERAEAGTPEEAAAFGEVVLLAVPIKAVPGLSSSIGRLLEGKTVLDAGNAYPARDGGVADEAQRHPGGSTAWVASQLPGAHVVKAFNTVYYRTLEGESRPGGQLGIPLAGDDDTALTTAEALVRDAGFTPVRVGLLAEGRRFEPGTPVYNTGMTAAEVARLLDASVG